MDDDITIPNISFFNMLDKAIEHTGGKSFKINRSWSHTLLNRKEIDQVGWFDERFLGGGEEDGDFEWRWANLYGEQFPDIHGFAIHNHWSEMDFDDCLVGQRKVHGKRSMFNLEFVNNKYKEDPNGQANGIMCHDGRGEQDPNYKKVICVDPTPNQYPSESFYWENKDKL
tara:strand:- start:131 stop:640 length:510 start_codon:yes stop_codon:yes gene_type:complete